MQISLFQILVSIQLIADFISSLYTFFFNQLDILPALGVFFFILLFSSLVIVPFIVVRIPPNYFSRSYRHKIEARAKNTSTHFLIILGKNLFGGILVLLGVIMLILPGQGLLTILLGVMLLDFPGKYRIERALIQKKPILNSINWLRIRFGQKPLEFD